MSTSAVRVNTMYSRWAPAPAEVVIIIAAVFLGASFAMPGAIAATVLGLAFLVLAALRIDAVLYGMILLLPILIVIPSLPMVIRDVSAILRYAMLIGFWIGCAARGERIRDSFFGRRLNTIIALYTGFLVVSLVGNQISDWTQRDLFRWVSYLALSMTLIGWVRTAGQLRRTLQVLAASTAAACLFGVYQVLSGGYTDLYFWLYPLHEEEIQAWVGRATSFLGHFNSLAGYINLVLPFTIATAVLCKGRTRALGVTGFCGGALILIFTQSRGALMGFAASILLGILYLLRDRKTRLKALVAVLVLTVAIAPLLILFSERFAEVDEVTSLGRLGMYLSAWNLFMSAPVHGHGFGNFRYLYDPVLAMAPVGLLDAHNVYLKALAETGIIGTFLLLYLFYSVMRIAHRRNRNARNRLDQIIGFGVLAALVTVLVHGFVDTLFEASPQFAMLFWLLIGILIVNERLASTPVPAPGGALAWRA